MDEGRMTRLAVILAALFFTSCASLDCLRNPVGCVGGGGGTTTPPTTQPPPPQSPEPSAPPTTTPPASPEPSPTAIPPTPKPPKPSPCITPGTCTPGCVSCAAWMAAALASGDVRRCEEAPQGFGACKGGYVYNDLNDDPAKRDCFDPQTCYLMWCDGSGVRSKKRLEREVCVDCKRDAPCSPPPSSPPASPTPETSPSPGTPNPGPTPGQCPPLVRWGGGIHAQMTPQFQGLPKTPVFAGNTIDFDSTARFGSGRGQPCNDEHHEVCSGPDGAWRRCEDPRGPLWRVTRGCGGTAKVINDGWGYRIQRVEAGECCVSITPREDVQDAEGQPVRVVGDASTEACVSVQ